MNTIPWPLVIVIFSLVVIIVIIVRKFPTLASIDISSLPSEQQSRLKKSLLANRLSRKFAGFLRHVNLFIVPTWRVAKKGIHLAYKKIRELEKYYRLKRKQGYLPDSPNPAELDILKEAGDHFDKSKLEEAEEAYIAIIQHNPTQIDAYEGLVEVYLAQKDYVHAQETLDYLLRLKGKSATKGENRKKAGLDLPTSEQQELAIHHYELGQVYERNDEREKAMRSYKEAVKLDSNNPKYLDSLIEISILLGNKLLAKKTLDKLKIVNQENTKIRDWQRRIQSL